MVNLLITAGADVNAVDKYNVTVMVIAKKQRMKKIIKILGTAGGKKAPQVPIDEATVKKMLKPSQQDNWKRKNNQRFNELLG